ncbi:MAG: class I SAM-dependent methyltransferase [Dehalococcoidia bacterium]
MTNPLRPSREAALEAWRALVAADAEQVPRVREPEPPRDYYQPTAAHFRAGVRATPELPALLQLAQPEDTWLDIGAGGGRLAVPLAAHVARVVAVEPSPAMRETLDAALAEAARTNVEVHDRRWPDPAWDAPVDVAMAAHSLYDIAEIDAFLDAMERHARRLCVALLRPWARGTALAALFEAVHGEPMQTLPGLREFVALVAARGCAPEVRLAPTEPEAAVRPRDAAFTEARRLLWLAEGSAKEQRMRALMEEWWGTPEGIAVPRGPAHIGVVSWEPGAGAPR